MFHLITISFRLCFRIHHQERSRKPGKIETEWNTIAPVYVDDVNMLGKTITMTKANTNSVTG
jgi:hypothetical protein